ncbi:nitroreductase family protein [Marinilabilia salmonicolor]|jgi:nitroreductase|uniref:Nitroreductase n=1 Tax=Marinilabilia salmonicolor TaxID=989 RepID=A0A2T0XT85_9BACT|nr:nitroreductase family protein [Marinilabilia salmonicolor]PRZ02164.1 nitroreductase [Marinilabilia salmonicolor]RCW36119.1 nitroreductase [Marinilabilia salmonicolor]
MNNLKDLIRRNRSYRRFYEEESIPQYILEGLVDLARLSPSARNAQTLKYFISCDAETNAKIFPHLSWAGYLPNWDGPVKGERPSAYIVVLNDTKISDNYFCDDGIAIQSILLGAVEQNLGGCIIGSVDRLKLSNALEIPKHLKIVEVIALGKPREQVVIEDLKDDNIKYWRDETQTHHVPKRALDEIIIKC